MDRKYYCKRLKPSLFLSLESVIIIIGFFLITAGAAYAHEDHGANVKKTFSKHFQQTLFDITEHAAFSVEVLLDDKESKIGKDVVGIVIHDDSDSDVKGATIRIALKDLETGDIATGPLVITDKNNGLYIVSGLNWPRERRWELDVTVKKGEVEDGVKFILPDALKTLYPKGRYSP
ncbi:MAG: hypothetical protein HQL08_05975 [Nitrospirae bacterium]|nr:hypothetical protein [Nitrospirota bacterium]